MALIRTYVRIDLLLNAAAAFLAGLQMLPSTVWCQLQKACCNSRACAMQPQQSMELPVDDQGVAQP